MSNGWDWIINRGRPSLTGNSHFKAAFDGAYVAPCPNCGKDTTWDADNCESSCPCDESLCPCGDSSCPFEAE